MLVNYNDWVQFRSAIFSFIHTLLVRSLRLIWTNKVSKRQQGTPLVCFDAVFMVRALHRNTNEIRSVPLFDVRVVKLR